MEMNEITIKIKRCIMTVFTTISTHIQSIHKRITENRTSFWVKLKSKWMKLRIPSTQSKQNNKILESITSRNKVESAKHNK